MAKFLETLMQLPWIIVYQLDLYDTDETSTNDPETKFKKSKLILAEKKEHPFSFFTTSTLARMTTIVLVKNGNRCEGMVSKQKDGRGFRKESFMGGEDFLLLVGLIMGRVRPV